MIRIRDNAGNVTEVKDGTFVEICDTDGNVAKVFYRDNQGLIRAFQPDDKEAQQYARLFNVSFSRLIPLSTKQLHGLPRR